MNSIKQKHRDATHNVYAYITRDNNITRFTDDGEPSGTAGLPTLDAIRKADFTDCAVVVTRYFGGTLLGTGGLVRAYSSAASKAIIAATPVIKRLSKIYTVTIPYELHGNVSYAISQMGFEIADTEYTEKVKIFVGVPFDKGDLLSKEIISVSGGRAKIECVGQEYVNNFDFNE